MFWLNFFMAQNTILAMILSNIWYCSYHILFINISCLFLFLLPIVMLVMPLSAVKLAPHISHFPVSGFSQCGRHLSNCLSWSIWANQVLRIQFPIRLYIYGTKIDKIHILVYNIYKKYLIVYAKTSPYAYNSLIIKSFSTKNYFYLLSAKS